MNRGCFFLYLTILLSSTYTYAQTAVIDSLKNALETSSDNSEKIDILGLLADQYQNPNEKIIYGRKAYSLVNHADEKSRIKAATNMGIFHGMLGQLDSSKFYFNAALASSLVLKDSIYITKAFNGLGNIARMQGDLDVALECFLNALSYSPDKTQQSSADIMSNIAGVYFDLKNYQAALEKVLEARAIYQSNNDQPNISFTDNLLAILYRALGDFEKSYHYNQEALKMLLEIKDTSQIIYNYINSTEILIEQKKFEEAAENALNTLSLARKFGDIDPQITSLLTLSSIYFRTSKLDKARAFANEAMNLAESLNFKAQLPRVYLMKSLIESASGNFNTSFELYEKHLQAQDSVRSKEMSNKISELSIQYETAIKEKEIARLSADKEIKTLEIAQIKTRNIFLSIIVLVVILVGSIVFYLYKQRIKINNQLRTAIATKDQLFSMIAHDIKNPLSAFQAITSTLEENYRSMEDKEVEMFISQLDSAANKLMILLQNLLDWSITESGHLRYYPEAVNVHAVADEAIGLFQGVIDTKNIAVKNNIDEKTIAFADYKMLFSILRNLISNAVKFTRKGGEIILFDTKKDDKIEIAIKDTGIGMSQTQLERLFENNSPTSKDGTGLGLQLCKTFIEKHGGTLQVESREGEGTTFKFSLHLQDPAA